MADGRAKLCVASTSEEDMYSSCFITTKYTCLKCKIPICNNCSVFEKDEDSSIDRVASPVNRCVQKTYGGLHNSDNCILILLFAGFPIIFAENKLLLIFISFSASVMFSRYVSPLTKIDNFP